MPVQPTEGMHSPLRQDEEGIREVDEATLLKCIDIIASRAEQLKDKGLSQMAFFVGVVNMLVVLWVFGVWPSYFWIVYIAESLFLFPIRFRHSAKASPSEVLYWLDFCWIANFICNLGLIVFLIDAYFAQPEMKEVTAQTIDNDHVREVLFCIFWGVACGPLLCAVGALGNAMIFHDVDNTASVFIHLCPSMLAYTLRWQRAEVLQTWPGMFRLDYFDEISAWSEIYGRGMAFYGGWVVIYTLWLAIFGMATPHKGYDTIFHCTMRGGTPIAKMLGWSGEENKRRCVEHDFTLLSAVIYMCFHATAVGIAMTMSVGCWYSQWFHSLVILAMAISTIYKGSARYTYYILGQYTAALRKEFGSVLDSPKAKALQGGGVRRP